MRTLILIGHGSHLNPDSGVAVYEYADLIRKTGLFDEVLEGYWKEEPSLRQVLRCAKYTDVTVIPMFISEGYFTENVIPREMGLGHQGPVPKEGIVRQIGGRTVRYTLPYGVHPSMSELIVARAFEACADISNENTGLFIIGHGTTRNKNSSRVVFENRDRIREMGIFGQVEVFFLDQEPKISGWQDVFKTPKVVMIPFFTAEGWHTQETIPEDLGLEGQVTIFPQHTAFYGMPVGTHPKITEVIAHVAEEAHGLGANGSGGDLEPEQKRTWNEVLERARAGCRIGEVQITPIAGLFEMRPILDVGRDDLERLASPEGVRHKVRRDDSGTYRPVHTLRNLPRGWVAMLSEQDLTRAIHYLYPAVAEEAFAFEKGEQHVTPWDSSAGRQTGIYGLVQQANEEEVAEMVRKACSSCLKTPLWHGQTLEKTFFQGVPGGIPCPEACTFVVAELRDVVGERLKREEAVDLKTEVSGSSLG